MNSETKPFRKGSNSFMIGSKEEPIEDANSLDVFFTLSSAIFKSLSLLEASFKASVNGPSIETDRS